MTTRPRRHPRPGLGYDLAGLKPLGRLGLSAPGLGAYGYADSSRTYSFDRPSPADSGGRLGQVLRETVPARSRSWSAHSVDVATGRTSISPRGRLLTNHRCLLRPRPRRVWSADMRYSVQAAVDAGLNFAVLGAAAATATSAFGLALRHLSAGRSARGRGGGCRLGVDGRRGRSETGRRARTLATGVTAGRRGVPVLRREQRPRGCGSLLVRLAGTGWSTAAAFVTSSAPSSTPTCPEPVAGEPQGAVPTPRRERQRAPTVDTGY